MTGEDKKMITDTNRKRKQKERELKKQEKKKEGESEIESKEKLYTKWRGKFYRESKIMQVQIEDLTKKIFRSLTESLDDSEAQTALAFFPNVTCVTYLLKSICTIKKTGFFMIITSKFIKGPYIFSKTIISTLYCYGTLTSIR